MSLVGIRWKHLCSSSSKFRLYVVDMYVELITFKCLLHAQSLRANYGKERGIPKSVKQYTNQENGRKKFNGTCNQCDR